MNNINLSGRSFLYNTSTIGHEVYNRQDGACLAFGGVFWYDLNMTESEIFNHLFKVAETSKDTRGIVASCLVRNGNILASSASSDDGRYHAEYLLLRKAVKEGIKLNGEDVVYSTLQPSGFRNPDGRGKDLPDSISDLIAYGIKHVVYGACDALNSDDISQRFEQAGGKMIQTENEKIINECGQIFNKSLIDPGQEYKKL